jgi:hypothetical protein
MSLFNSVIYPIVTDDINEATHWVAKLDPESSVKEFIIPNKEYKLIKHDDGFEYQEYFIKGEDGNLSMYYLLHKGDYIIKEGN